ncbi:hypothetical protein SUGI_0201160 [Cryptomeria japonica]|nr:hypothetical protein SUGI_0201160 [Cryptomeria japonica]
MLVAMEPEFSELLNLMAREIKKIGKDEEALKLFVKDHTNFISASEPSYVMITWKDKLTDEELEQMIKEAAVDRDGQVVKFVQLVSLSAVTVPTAC